MDGTWGFDEADDEFEPVPGASEKEDDFSEQLSGQDAAGIVTVWVTPLGDVGSVHVSRQWRSLVDIEGLQRNVAEAMNAATAHVLAEAAEQADMSGDEHDGTTGVPTTSEPPVDETPITLDYVMQLLGNVSVDVEHFIQRMPTTFRQTVSAESGGKHVSVTGMHRQVNDVSIDVRWVARARATEVETELRDVLGRFAAQFSVGELAGGPHSPAITELMDLVSHPETTLRRVKKRSV